MTRLLPIAAAAGALMTLAIALPRDAEAVQIQVVDSPGGISAWLVEDYTVPIVTMNLALRGGAAQDAPELPGVANFLSSMLDEGAGDLDSKAFQTRLHDLNINFDFDAGRDSLSGNLRTLSTNRQAAFELMRLALTAPRFDQEPLERVRGQILSRLRREETEPREIASRAMREALFPGHPYGRPVDGTVESVSAIGADDLRDYHRRVVARDNLHVVVVGAIDAPSLAAALDDMFGTLPEKAQLRPVPEIAPAAGTHRHEVLAVPQTTILVGGASLKRDDPDFIAAYVANHILGGGTFSSRLYKEIRDKRGLSYGVGTGLSTFDHAGAYFGSAATRADAAPVALDVILSEIRAFAETGPTAEELEAAKAYLTGNYALRFDASRKIARQLLGVKLDRLGVDYVDKRNDLVRAVTLEDVRRAARRVFGGETSVVTVGPGET